MHDARIWIDACEQWILDGVIEGCTPYYVNVTFKQLPGRDRAIVPQMHRAIEKGFYGPFCTRLCRHPRAVSEQDKLPRLWLFPDLPVRKNCGLPVRTLDINAGGLHFNGPLLIPAKTRFKGDVAKHIMDDQPYARRGIQHIDVIKITHDLHSLSDYAAKTVGSGRVPLDDILVLPRVPSELSSSSIRLPRRERLVRELVSRFNISPEIAYQIIRRSATADSSG